MRFGTLGVMAAMLCATASVAHAGDVDGAWDLVFQTEDGTRTSSLSVTTDGESATATMGETRLTGTYKDGLLELTGEHYVTDLGYASTLTIKGRVEGAELKGEWVWSEYGSVFAGTRPQG
jgi:hypothetical protein